MSARPFIKGQRVRAPNGDTGTFDELVSKDPKLAWVIWDTDGFRMNLPTDWLELIPAPNVTEMQELWAAIAELQAHVATLEAERDEPSQGYATLAEAIAAESEKFIAEQAALGYDAELVASTVLSEPPAAKAVAPKLTPAKLRLSRQMRNALEVYAEPQYIVDGLTIETVDGHYVGMMDRRIQQSMCKRGFVADSSEITHKRTFAITDLGRDALKAVSS